MTASAAEDLAWMRRALALARRGGRTHPNPSVGAVLVRDGRLLAEGRHRGVGTAHAEADALSRAMDGVRGATLYVTLEPCVHERRPDGSARVPCTRRCIDAGIVRVVAAMEDPDPLVAGGGFRRLRADGIRVDVGVGSEAAVGILAAYVKHRTYGLPLVTHKAASTRDGKIAAVGGDARWVTGPEARRAVHRLRARADAVVVGVGTVLADDPQLDVRLAGRSVANPLRVVCDSRLRTPPTARVAVPGTLVATSEALVSSDGARRLADRGVEVRGYPVRADGRLDVVAIARDLARRGICEVLLEAGGTLSAAFHEAGLVDRVWFHFAPKLVGGASAPTPIDGGGLVRRMADAVRLTKVRVRRYGEDIAIEAWIDADPNRLRPEQAAGAA
ncbi:MAG: bifunctional diaminohydroxyphosphoribosylaminopyrimidine deaminase/5-amino-6-(5-phosphoribosylamino)uracil reductase RibD [Armatimonadota bacterium]